MKRIEKGRSCLKLKWLGFEDLWPPDLRREGNLSPTFAAIGGRAGFLKDRGKRQERNLIIHTQYTVHIHIIYTIVGYHII